MGFQPMRRNGYRPNGFQDRPLNALEYTSKQHEGKDSNPNELFWREPCYQLHHRRIYLVARVRIELTKPGL